MARKSRGELSRRVRAIRATDAYCTNRLVSFFQADSIGSIVLCI